ncbi:helix-turn-helix transcriptional regulator [Nocardia cyriacigeorgica]|uniref:Helix-turn-helix transcriptional regulator n=2 Tax=Nocardia cyriacigeorgica TaxID=135487 RepID=A0A6P1DC80_9NOCA|nr:helix-turn-helix transcriptional regulator [Nocardia cyriacigeorgica]NEW47798.1 helix-turn-helix transcriptional regulator [Nocardia cyriacigeorgica]
METMLRRTTDTPHVMGDGHQVATNVRDVLKCVGDKWSVLVIAELTGDPRRFLQLHRSVPGISQRMLTVTLRRLERDGLIARTVYPTVPIQVEYALTPMGRSLLSALEVIAEWSARHRAAVMASRGRWDAADLARAGSVA